MARKAWIAIALVVWLIVLAFRGVSVSALPNHVVAGGVLGPGGDISPGAGNAANAAGMVFYSTSQPSYTLLTGADSYTPASGTQPALWAKDVGASWNWAAGDVMVAVVETVRGVNGWTSVNSTTSIDGILMAGARDLRGRGARPAGACGPLPGVAATPPPTAALTAPGVCATGNNPLLIRWTMSDAETATASLRVWLNYTVSATVNPIAGVQDRTGFSSPATYSWTTPTLNTNVNIVLTVMDGGGLKATVTSPSAMIDSTAPTGSMTAPTVGATSVAVDAAVVITFIEAMNRTATQGAISFSPVVTGLTFAWSVGATAVAMGHAAFAANTQYTLTVSTAAKDACSPGTPIASAYTATFKTAPASGSTNGPLPIDPLWIIIAIIVVALVIVGLLLMRRRKPTPAPGVGMPSESPPEAPMDESRPPDESLAPPTDM